MEYDNYKLVSYIMLIVIFTLMALNYSQYREIKYLREKSRQITTQNELSFLHRREKQCDFTP